MNGSCHCGRVTIRVPERPAHLNACNCTLCTKLGTLWGYYRPDEVTIAGDPAAYVRGDMDDPALATHFCPDCGAVSHWTPRRKGTERMGINMRLFEPAELAGLELRFGDRRNHAHGPYQYRPPTTFADAGDGR